MDLNLFGVLVLLCAQGVTSIYASTSKAWIAAGHFDPAKISPLCGLSCIQVFQQDSRTSILNTSVGMHRCSFSPSGEDTELWSYNSSSKAITISQRDDKQSREAAAFCLQNGNITSCSGNIPFKGISNYPTKVANCTGAKSQQWYLQDDGRIRSALLSRKGEVLYLQSPSLNTEPGGRTPLCLGPANTGNSQRHLNFTFIPYPTNGTLYSTIMVAIPSPGDGQNLVSNGGFEYSAPRSTSAAPAANFTLSPGDPDLCYWTAGEDSQTGDNLSSVVVTSRWSQPGWKAQQGNNSLLMGGKGLTADVTVTQFIHTRAGSKYSLSFFLAGYPKPCGNKYLRVLLSPSSDSSAFIVDKLFVSGSANTYVEWKHISLSFVARTEATNLTFLNPMKAGICAPIIDNVSIVKSEDATSYVIAVAIPAAITSGVMIVILVLYFMKRAGNLRRRPVTTAQKEEEKKQVVNGDDIRTYTMEELFQATDNFSTKIGEGGFGTVYRANLGGNVIGAVKRATRRGTSNSQNFKEELSVLLRLNHPNLVNLIGLCFENGEQILVFEFIPNGSLYDRIHREGNETSPPLSWSARMNIALQIAVALQYLHEEATPPILHRDVKSANVLLVDDNRAKLADFGLSKLGMIDFQAKRTPIKGSYGYTDPQYMQTGVPSTKSDVYSFGVLLLELITGLKAVQGVSTLVEATAEKRSSHDKETMLSIVDPMIRKQTDLKEVEMMMGIVNMCLREEGQFRPSMREIVEALTVKVYVFPQILIRDGDADDE